MQESFAAFHNKLKPFEDICYTWLGRVFLAGILAGSAWIDDAPPLSLAAMAITLYTILRILMHFGEIAQAVPFTNSALKYFFALFAVAVLGLCFLTVFTFTEYVSLSAVEYYRST